MDTHTDWQSGNDELCRCDACVKERADFDDWCNAFEERFNQAEREGKVARVTCLPSGLLGLEVSA